MGDINRYYYTEPLASAWMMNTHKVNIQVHHAWNNIDYGMLDVTVLRVDALNIIYYMEAVNATETFAFECGDDYLPRKLYVHPGSISIFTIEPNDLLQTGNDTCDYVDYIGDSGICFMQGSPGIDLNLKGSDELRIIQRNGKAFIWPKIEVIKAGK